MLKVSIIIPVYNVENYLKRCLNSVINQTYKNIELLLIDDGSTDRSGIICDEYNERYSFFVNVIHKTNGGLSDARNVGIKEATGDYIMFVDSDDFINEKMVEILVNCVNKTNANIVACDFEKVTSDNEILPIYNEKSKVISGRDLIKQIFTGEEKNISFISVCKLIEKKILIDNDIYFPVGRYYEDTFTTHKILLEASKVVVLKQKLYYYRTREGSITMSAYNRKKVKDAILADKEVIITFEKKSDYEMLVLAFKNYCRSQILYYRNIMKSGYNKNLLGKVYLSYKNIWKKYNKRCKLQLKYKIIYKLFIIFPDIICRIF